MTPKQRVMAAVKHQTPDRIPLAVQEIENEHQFAAYMGIEDPKVPSNPDIGYYAPSYEMLGIDCFRLNLGYKADGGTSPDGESLNEWGAVAKKDYGAGHWYPLADASSIQDVEKYNWPNPDLFDYAYDARKAKRISERFAVRGPNWWPIICQVFDMVGMEQAMVKMISEPAVFEAMIEMVFQLTYECTEKLIIECGDDMPIVCCADDFASQMGMLISPSDWRRYLKPRYAKLFNLAKKHNKYVWFHSCGNIVEVLPDLIEIGMDVWETVQLHTLPITPKQLKMNYGKDITFFGAVNSQKLPFMTVQDVREETIRCIETLGEGGGYICSADHGIRADVPYDIIKMLFDTARNFRKAGYTLDTTV